MSIRVSSRVLERKIGQGLQPFLQEKAPEGWGESDYTCPLVLEGNCEGVKDPEYGIRCFGKGFNYASCRIYQLSVNGSEQVSSKTINPNDTVIMHADEIIKTNRINKKSRALHSQSADEAIDEGASVSEVIGFAKSIRSSHRGRYEEYDHRDGF